MPRDLGISSPARPRVVARRTRVASDALLEGPAQASPFSVSEGGLRDTVRGGPAAHCVGTAGPDRDGPRGSRCGCS